MAHSCARAAARAMIRWLAIQKVPEMVQYERRAVRLRALQDHLMIQVLLLLDKRHKVGLMSWWTPRGKEEDNAANMERTNPSASHVSGKGLVLTCQVDWCKAGWALLTATSPFSA